jgi:DNA-directed DNA polymerase III PolC
MSIVHLDADAFFVSCEQAADPRLRGKPVAVGGQKRGIIASASYEARKLGVYTPMPTAHARRICPKLIVIPGDFGKYEHFSRMMFSYAYDFTPEVEMGGIDEGYVDLRSNKKRPAREIAETIQKAVSQTLKLSASFGIGENKLVSQIASKLRKPAGFIEVEGGHERNFVGPLSNRWLPNIGPKAGAVLDAAGLKVVDQIAQTSPDLLAYFVGGYAPQLWKFAQGVDDRPIVAEREEAKSYGEQQTFGEDVTDEAFVLATLRGMADRLMAKVRADNKTIRTFTVKLRYNDFDDTTKSQSLEEPTDIETELYDGIASLVRAAWDRRVSLRLVSLRLSHVYDGIFRQELALVTATNTYQQKKGLAEAIDVLRSRFGDNSIMRGHDFWLKRRDGRPRSDVERPYGTRIRPRKSPARPARFYPLNCKSYYSFCDSLLAPEEIVAIAVARGAKAVALTDPNLHGAVPFYQAAIAAGIKPLIGAEFPFLRKVAYAQNTEGYRNLCFLLSQPKPTPSLLAENAKGLRWVDSLSFPAIRYHHPEEKLAYQIIQSIRTLTLVAEKHSEKRTEDFHIPSEDRWEADVRLAEELVAECDFQFEFGKLRFPAYQPKEGGSPRDLLRRLATDGLHRRYGPGHAQHRGQLEEELSIIAEVGYEEYFLTVWDMLQECRQLGIEWITRGSAADSLVCYCLGISGVCPIRFDLYFRRFLNRDRMALNKLPDIDLDFPHDRKDDVVDLVFRRYGTTHAAVVGGFSTFQARSAVAEIGKVLGLSEFQVRRLTEFIPNVSARDIQQAVGDCVESSSGVFAEEPAKTAMTLAAILDGFPRYPKMHPCGMVLSRDPILHHTPTFSSSKGYPTTHFDMDSVEEVGLIKLDILAQGGLAVMRDARKMIEERGISVDLESLEPWEDPAVWEMVATGNGRGVHHIESPAMITLSKMCDVRDVDVLIAIVSVIRPGAANTGRKTDFALRAQGLQEIDYTHSSLARVLKSTFGVVAYEEHILQICEAFADMPAGRADILRRSLVKQKPADVEKMRVEFWSCAERKGRTQAEIESVWNLLFGFQGYAFCRAHSTAYGVEAYQAAHLKRYHPAEFLAAVLTNEKGFYSPLAYTLEARRLGIGFLSPDVNASRAGFYPEYFGAEAFLRVPLWKVKELTDKTADRIAAEVRQRPFANLKDFYNRVVPTKAEAQNMIRTGAFDSFGEPRTTQFWHLQQLADWPHDDAQGVLFSSTDREMRIPEATLTEPSLIDRMRDEQELLGFTISGHPLDLFPHIAWERYCPIAKLCQHFGERVKVCGLSFADRIAYQENGQPMKFISLCDYSGFVESELFAAVYRAFGMETIKSPVIEVEGFVEPFENKKGFTLRVLRVGSPPNSI